MKIALMDSEEKKIQDIWEIYEPSQLGRKLKRISLLLL